MEYYTQTWASDEDDEFADDADLDEDELDEDELDDEDDTFDEEEM